MGIGYNGFPNGCSDDALPWAREASNEFMVSIFNVFLSYSMFVTLKWTQYWIWILVRQRTVQYANSVVDRERYRFMSHCFPVIIVQKWSFNRESKRLFICLISIMIGIDSFWRNEILVHHQLHQEKCLIWQEYVSICDDDDHVMI